jgi:hypothetical protein
MQHRNVDLDKPSHERFADSCYLRLMRMRISYERRDLYLRMANDAELRGDYAYALRLREEVCRLRHADI